MAAIDQLTNLAGIIQTVQGTEQRTRTRSSGTQTTQTQVSDAGVNQLIQNILSGPGGVRAIGGAARQSGLYNASTEDLLLGDLYSRAAVQSELARSPTVVSTTGDQTAVTETPGIGLGGIGGVLAAGQLGKALFGGSEAGGGLLGGAGEAVSSLFGGAGAAASAAPAVTSTVTGAAAGATPGALVNAGVAGTAGGALAGTAAEAAAGQAASSGAGAAGTGAAAAGGASGFGFNAATAIPLGGSFLGGLLGGREASQDPGSLAVSALAGAAALGPIGLIAAPLAAIAGGFLSDLSVVCTALERKGLISKQLHKKGEAYFSTISTVTKVGYWLWGEWAAKKISSGSVFWTLFMLPVTKSYLSYLGTDRSFLSAYDHPLGALAHWVGEPICTVLGHAELFYRVHIKRYS